MYVEQQNDAICDLSSQKVGRMDKPHIDLKVLRKNKGWTQAQAAKRLGFCRTYISDVENGRQSVSKAMMHAIIQVFEVKYEDFYRHNP